MIFVVFGTKLVWPLCTLAGSLMAVAVVLDRLWRQGPGSGARQDVA